MRILLAVVLLFITAAHASAQDYKTLLDLPQDTTLVSLSATEQVEVQQDLLVANLRYETTNTDPRKLQDEINTLMKKALDEAQKVSSVKAATQQYHVYEFDRSAGKGTRRDMAWRGQQGLMIKGKKADDLLELTGKLQDMGLSMSGLNYQVSPELLEETRESLLEDALKKLMAKADRTAKAIGKSKSELLQINVDMGGYYPQPQMMRSDMAYEGAAMKTMAAPVAAPGESQITLTVSAQALLKP